MKEKEVAPLRDVRQWDAGPKLDVAHSDDGEGNKGGEGGEGGKDSEGGDDSERGSRRAAEEERRAHRMLGTLTDKERREEK